MSTIQESEDGIPTAENENFTTDIQHPYPSGPSMFKNTPITSAHIRLLILIGPYEHGLKDMQLFRFFLQ